MDNVGGIAHITNFPVRAATDGGSQREKALAEFIAAHGGVRLTVQDEDYHSSKSAHFARLPRLFREIAQIGPGLVVLNYPSYPFLWQHKVGPYFLMSLLFASGLRRLADRLGFRVAIDVMDLPAFQYADLGYALSMSPGTLRRFDRYVFSAADHVWVCSGLLAKLIHERYGIDRSGIVVALNGYDPGAKPGGGRDGCLQVAYSGSLNPERGIEPVIEAFLANRGSSQLHLCGTAGEWIPDRFADSRIVYHGALSDREASERLSGCQIGLIPYPEKGYYNLAFATKLAFYLGIGLPVLCSEVEETGEYVRNMGIGMCAPISRFSEAIDHISRHPEQIREWKQQVMSVREVFSWPNIYTLALEESLRRTSESSTR